MATGCISEKKTGSGQRSLHGTNENPEAEVTQKGCEEGLHRISIATSLRNQKVEKIIKISLRNVAKRTKW